MNEKNGSNTQKATRQMHLVSDSKQLSDSAMPYILYCTHIEIESGFRSLSKLHINLNINMLCAFTSTRAVLYVLENCSLPRLFLLFYVFSCILDFVVV